MARMNHLPIALQRMNPLPIANDSEVQERLGT